MDIRLVWSLLGYGRAYNKLSVPSDLSDLATTDRRICVYVYLHSAMRQDDIARELQIGKTTVAKSLDRLEKKGYILREANKADRRAKAVSLTGLGRSRFSAFSGIHGAWVDAVSGCLTPEENAEFDRLCKKLQKRARCLLEEKKRRRAAEKLMNDSTDRTGD